MELNQMIKDAINDHKESIEMFQISVMNSVASLIYSEYLSKMDRKLISVGEKGLQIQKIFVPTLRSVQELLFPEGQMMTLLSEKFIDEFVRHSLRVQYSSIPEFEIFKDYDNNIEIMKSIFDVYIIPNISRTIPEVIAAKFRLRDPANQTFIESREIDMFDRIAMGETELEYLVEESLLNLLVMSPNVEREQTSDVDNMDFTYYSNEIISISNVNAIAPIYINSKIINDMGNILNKINFVTDTSIRRIGDPKFRDLGDGSVSYQVRTGAFNMVTVIRLGNTM